MGTVYNSSLGIFLGCTGISCTVREKSHIDLNLITRFLREEHDLWGSCLLRWEDGVVVTDTLNWWDVACQSFADVGRVMRHDGDITQKSYHPVKKATGK